MTGLYTTVACLVGYAIFGPSRVLVLGPDSSLAPMILAAIAPLAIADDPMSAVVLAGMLSLMVGLIEIGLGLGKLGFVADLLSSEVQVGYLNGLAITIIVGQLPKLFGYSAGGDDFFADVQRLRREPRRDRVAGPRHRGRACWLVLLVLPASPAACPRCSWRWSAPPSPRPRSAWPPRASPPSGVLPQGIPRPSLPWTSFADLGPAPARAPSASRS